MAYLIEKGAQVDVKAKGGLTAYGLALVSGNTAVSALIKTTSETEAATAAATAAAAAASKAPGDTPRASVDEEVLRAGAMKIVQTRKAISAKESFDEVLIHFFSHFPFSSSCSH